MLHRTGQIAFMTIKFLLDSLWEKITGESGMSVGERVCRLIVKLGPTYVKFAQILSTRMECPPWLINEIEKLQDRVDPRSYKEVKASIEEGLGTPMDELFTFFDKKPVAAASLAQVHEAVLGRGEDKGKRVAVKVQRPGLEKLIEVDLGILDFGARVIYKLMPRTRGLNLPGVVDAFAAALRREVDFILEGRCQDKVALNFKNDPTVHIPKIYWDYTTKKVLTMEFIEGIKISKLEELEKVGIDRRQLAINLTRSYMKQIWVDGYFHADPHPGNLFVLKGEVIVFLDFGMMEYLEEDMLDKFGEFMLAGFYYVDPVKTARIAIRNLHTGNPEDVDYDQLERAVRIWIERHFVEKKLPLKQKGVGNIMDEIIYIAYKHGFRLPQPVILVIKGLVYCEALAIKLDPKFDVMEMFAPYFKQRLRRTYLRKLGITALEKPEELASSLTDFASEVVEFVKVLPKQTTAILNKMEHGEFELNVKNNNNNHHLLWGIAIGMIIALLAVIVVRT